MKLKNINAVQIFDGTSDDCAILKVYIAGYINLK